MPDVAIIHLLLEEKNAADVGAKAILITIDTPGGGLEETEQIVKLIEGCKKLTIGFVYPKGATAWSAGVFVLLSTDIAAMQQSTVIGSCQPVEITSSGVKPVNES
ncbi:MAG: nodulation protein NfeD, partial [Desulfobulbus sp.]